MIEASLSNQGSSADITLIYPYVPNCHPTLGDL